MTGAAHDRKGNAMKCTELLEKDHQLILRAVDVLDEMADQVKRGEPVDFGDVELIIRFLKEFEDEHHQTKEESALFPLLLNNPGSQGARLRQMLFEHDQERSLVEGLEDALRTKHGADFVQFANRLITLLRSHISKEEFALFSLIELVLSDDQKGCVLAEFHEFDRRLERGCGTDLLRILRLLETKYLRRRSA